MCLVAYFSILISLCKKKNKQQTLPLVWALKLKCFNGRAESKGNVASRKKKLLLNVVEFKIEFKNRLLFVWAFLICHWFVPFKRSILFYWDWRANGNCNSGVLPNIPRKSCWIMRNNWQVSWMMWRLAFVYDSFHPGISACMGYKYVVSTNPQTGLKLCCLNSSLLFGWNPCDSGNPGNQRGLATVVSQVECAYL